MSDPLTVAELEQLFAAVDGAQQVHLEELQDDHE